MAAWRCRDRDGNQRSTSNFTAARKQVEQVVVGKPMPILAFTALLAGGHVLFDIRVGKTTLVQTIAKTLDIPFPGFNLRLICCLAMF